MCEKTAALVEKHKPYLPLYVEVANPALTQNHWRDIFETMGAGERYSSGHTYSVVQLVELGILDHLDAVANIGAAASKQYSMLKALEKMVAAWADLEFHCVQYKSSSVHVLGQTEEIQMLLDDQLMKIQAMNASPFVKPFKERAMEWEKTMFNLQVRGPEGWMQPRQGHSPEALRTACVHAHRRALWCHPRRSCWTTGFRCSQRGCTWSPSSAARTS